jgi:tRNA(Ile)-lysidine synthase
MSTRRKPIDWPAAAEALARAIPKARLHPRVVAAAEAMSVRTVWGVGFSGGADSLSLLLLLWAHWPKRRRSLRALHFDHRLRGAASRADAAFCRQVCAALGVKFVGGAWPGRHRGASEAEAREARLHFLGRHARILWFGHHQDDVAESMFMRLARGSGAGGLAAPRPVQPHPQGRVHLRLLLDLKKAELVAALRAAGIPWREDASNEADAFFRNRIRRDVVPAWTAAARRDAVAGAARARELLEEDDAAIEAWLAELPWRAARGGLAVRPLAGKPRALTRRALHRWLRAAVPPMDLSRPGFEALLAAVERGSPTRHSLGTAGFGEIRDGVLRFVRVGKARGKIKRPAN